MRNVVSQQSLNSRRFPRGSVTMGIIAAALVISTSVAIASGHRSQSDVYTFDGELVNGASAHLVRTPNGVSMSVTTAELDAGSAYTVWWVVFNHPEFCAFGIEDLTNCGEGDLANPDVEVAVLYAAGNVVGTSGRAGFASNLKVGDLSGCQEPFDGFGLCANGLVNPLGAEIHLVIRSHNEIIPSMMPAMIHTFTGGCTPETSEGVGAGPNECEDQQFAAFVP